MVERNPNWNLIEFQRWDQYTSWTFVQESNKYYSIISATWNVAKNPSKSHGDWKKLSRARELLYWPGISQEIKDLVEHCEICNGHRNEQTKQPLPQLKCLNDRGEKWPLIYSTWMEILTLYILIVSPSSLKCWCYRIQVLQLLNVFDKMLPYTESLKNSSAIMHRSIPVICFKLLRESSASSTLSRLYVTPENLNSEKDCANNCQDPYLALLELRDTPLPTV